MTSKSPLLLLREKTTLAQGLHGDRLLSYFCGDKSSQFVIFKIIPIKVPEESSIVCPPGRRNFTKGTFCLNFIFNTQNSMGSLASGGGHV